MPLRMPSIRSIRLPTMPSRRVCRIGVPAHTAASNSRPAPFASARCARSRPCCAIIALLAVTSDRPWPSDSRARSSAGPSVPPITSATASIPSRRASSTGSSHQRHEERSIPRSLVRSRALTATTSIGRPARVSINAACSVSRRTTPAPTVPSPAIPSLNASLMARSDAMLHSRRQALAAPMAAEDGRDQ